MNKKLVVLLVIVCFLPSSYFLIKFLQSQQTPKVILFNQSYYLLSEEPCKDPTRVGLKITVTDRTERYQLPEKEGASNSLKPGTPLYLEKRSLPNSQSDSQVSIIYYELNDRLYIAKKSTIK